MRVLFLGAASSIGRALAARFARDGATLFLAARDRDDLERIADDLRVRTGTRVFTGIFDATDFQRHESFLRECVSTLGGLDGVVLCFGTLGDQEQIEHAPREARGLLEENLDGAVSLLMIAANHLEAQQSGFIIVLGSVAGDRGRRSNYVYAAGKAGLEVFTQGLRARLGKASVHVLTVKLGQVDTRMTYGRERLMMVASPERVAGKIHAAWARGADVVYVPWFWRVIMTMVKLMPERIFKRLDL